MGFNDFFVNQDSFVSHSIPIVILFDELSRVSFSFVFLSYDDFRDGFDDGVDVRLDQTKMVIWKHFSDSSDIS